MCGTRKLQCHVQGLQPIDICGIGKRARMILLCWSPSLPGHHHETQNHHGEGHRAQVTWTLKIKGRLFLIELFMHSLIPPLWLSSYLPFQNKHSSTISWRPDPGQLLRRLWWKWGCCTWQIAPFLKVQLKDAIHVEWSHLPLSRKKLAWWNRRITMIIDNELVSNLICHLHGQVTMKGGILLLCVIFQP